MASPPVCAGPTSMNRTSLPPTRSVSSPSRYRSAVSMHAFEIEARAHDLVKEGGAGAERAPIAHQRRKFLGRVLLHLLGAAARGDDLDTRHQLVAEGVVAIGMGVDQGPDVLDGW